MLDWIEIDCWDITLNCITFWLFKMMKISKMLVLSDSKTIGRKSDFGHLLLLSLYARRRKSASGGKPGKGYVSTWCLGVKTRDIIIESAKLTIY